LTDFTGKPVRAFVVWEPVLPTDWGPPSTAALKRISDSRAVQFWDKDRLVSHRMGERDKDSIVWDQIAVFAPGVSWENGPPQSVWADRPVVRVMEPARSAITKTLRDR
jgi:hypothetical protein